MIAPLTTVPLITQQNEFRKGVNNWLGGGNDTLEFDGTSITGFTAKLTINGAAGNDMAVVRTLTSGKGVLLERHAGYIQVFDESEFAGYMCNKDH